MTLVTSATVTWTLTSKPTFDTSCWNGTFPVTLYTDESGEAAVTYEADEAYGEGADWQPQDDTSSLDPEATVELDGDALLASFQ